MRVSSIKIKKPSDWADNTATPAQTAASKAEFFAVILCFYVWSWQYMQYWMNKEVRYRM
jgi:hypothetical protein